MESLKIHPNDFDNDTKANKKLQDIYNKISGKKTK